MSNSELVDEVQICFLKNKTKDVKIQMGKKNTASRIWRANK